MRQRTPNLPDHQLEIRDSRVFVGLSALMVWAPLPLASNRTWAVGILVLCTLLLLAGTAYAWRHDADAASSRLSRFRWPLLLLAGFTVLAWLQTLPLPESWLALLSPETLRVERGITAPRLSIDVFRTRIYASLSFAYLSCFLVAVLTLRTGPRLDRMAQVLVASGVLQALLGVFLFSSGASYRLFYSDVSHVTVIGSYINRNHFAGYMELCLSIGIGLMLARLGTERTPGGNWRHKLSRALAFVISPKMRLRLMLVIMVIALVLTRSRMGNSAFFAAMLVVGLVTIVLARRAAPATVGLILSLVIIDVFVVGTWVGLEKVVERVHGTNMTVSQGGAEESVEAREDAASYALPLIRDFPVFGTGGGSFYTSYMRYRTQRPGFFDHAHNDYIEIAADCGLLGLGMLLALAASTAWKALRVLRQRHSSLPRGIAFGVLMSIVALGIHSAVDFNLQIPANALTLVLILAMGWVAADLPSSGSGRRGAG